jgi:hypothetical protein
MPLRSLSENRRSRRTLGLAPPAATARIARYATNPQLVTSPWLVKAGPTLPSCSHGHSPLMASAWLPLSDSGSLTLDNAGL